MFINSTVSNNYIDKTLISSWRIEFLIIFLLICLLILFFWLKYYIENLFINKQIKQKRINNHQQPLKTIISKRKQLVSKSTKKLSNKLRQKTKSNQSINTSSSIKLSLVLSKETNNPNDTKQNFDQNLSHISLLTIQKIEPLKSKHISLELPSINLTHDPSNHSDNISSSKINFQD